MDRRWRSISVSATEPRLSSCSDAAGPSSQSTRALTPSHDSKTAVSAAGRSRLTIENSTFADAVLPEADLVFAGMSLRFCQRQEIRRRVDKVTAAIRPGGWFIGHLFGDHDSWADDPDMTFLTRGQVLALLEKFQIEVLREQDKDGNSTLGPKHWHVFHVIARRQDDAGRSSA